MLPLPAACAAATHTPGRSPPPTPAARLPTTRRSAARVRRPGSRSAAGAPAAPAALHYQAVPTGHPHGLLAARARETPLPPPASAVQPLARAVLAHYRGPGNGVASAGGDRLLDVAGVVGANQA